MFKLVASDFLLLDQGVDDLIAAVVCGDLPRERARLGVQVKGLERASRRGGAV